MAEADGCLGESEADVWCARLDCPPQRLEACQAVLSPDELQRAERFRFAQDRQRYVIGRYVLRKILARYLNCAAQVIAFAYNSAGKPSLAGSATEFRFNVAHSQNVAIYAVTKHREIGVDVEAIRSIAEWMDIAQRFFSAAEHARLLALPPEKRLTGFYHCWTRKEACLKAMGTGLGGGLAEMEVSLDPDQRPELLRHPAGVHELGQWHLFSSVPARNYLAALAIRGSLVQPRWRQWNEA